MKRYTKKLTDDQKKSLIDRVYGHTSVNNTAVVVLTAKELQELMDHIFHLEAEVRSYERAAEALSQALNEGDGVYRP